MTSVDMSRVTDSMRVTVADYTTFNDSGGRQTAHVARIPKTTHHPLHTRSGGCRRGGAVVCTSLVHLGSTRLPPNLVPSSPPRCFQLQFPTDFLFVRHEDREDYAPHKLWTTVTQWSRKMSRSSRSSPRQDFTWGFTLLRCSSVEFAS
jgi:hypothetical protein